MDLPDQLLRHAWMHSHEEDRGDEMIFRPSTFTFPPSRGRHGFSLNPDGTAVLVGPDPADRAVERPAQWHIEPDNRLVLRGPQDSLRVLEITSAQPDKLVVKESQ